jgi:hypothetical protein
MCRLQHASAPNLLLMHMILLGAGSHGLHCSGRYFRVARGVEAPEYGGSSGSRDSREN